MPIYELNRILTAYFDGYLILDFNHLFIASSLREEIWLLQQKDDMALLHAISDKARQFGIADIRSDKDFETYSGGQRAILCCLLVLTIVQTLGVRDVRVLLRNILESLSRENKKMLLDQFRAVQSAFGLRLFDLSNGRLEEISLNFTGALIEGSR